MNTALRAARAALLVLAAAAAPALAQTAAPSPFHVTYQYKDLSATGGKVTGKVLLTVLNLSGRDARDVSISAAGESSLTFDRRDLRLGSIANGLQSHRIEIVDAPGALPDGPLPDTAQLSLRFTDGAGALQEVTVSARRLP